jgi:hypothetical protein
MRLREITSITGIGGLFKMEVQRADGMIVRSLTEGWTKFIPSRTHGFTPLENIAIYTEEDTVPLAEVLIKMHEARKKSPLPAASASAEEFRSYLETILPDYDREKVYVSDMKKLVRWYAILDEHGVIAAEVEAAAEAEKASDADEEKPAQEAPAKAKAAVKKAAAQSSGSKAADALSKAAKGSAAKPSAPKAPAVSKAGKSRNKTD